MGAANGQCQSNGYCSFPADECDSGYAYGDLVPTDLAGSCVPIDDAITTGMEASTGGDGGQDDDDSDDDAAGTMGGTAAVDDTSGDGPGAADSGDSDTGSSGTDDSDTTERPVTCTEEGLTDAACDRSAPFCVEGTCSSCTSVPESGCYDSDPATAVCDAESGGCTACFEHTDCFTGACFRATGECVAPANRLWVDPLAPDCDDAVGTEASPLCSIGEAFALIDAQPGSEGWAVFPVSSVAPYAESSIWGPDAHPTALIGPPSGPAVRLETTGFTAFVSTGDMYVANVVFDGGGTNGLECGGNSRLWVDDSEFRGYQQRGFTVSSCEAFMRRVVVQNNNELGVSVSVDGQLHIDDSVITSNLMGMHVLGELDMNRTRVSNSYVGGGVHIDGGAATITNSMLWLNVYAFFGTQVNNGGSLDLLYTTIADGLTCDETTDGSIRNSVITQGGCQNWPSSHSALVEFAAFGDDNVSLEGVDLDDIYVDPAAYDFHVLMGAETVDNVAQWQAGDPALDIDGDVRPAIDGTPDYAGADVP